MLVALESPGKSFLSNMMSREMVIFLVSGS